MGRVGRFQLTRPRTDLRLDFTQQAGSAHVVGALSAPAPVRAATRNRVDCLDGRRRPTATRTFPALAAGVYWLIVESYPGVPGATTVTLSTGVARDAGDLRQRQGRRRQRPHRLPGRRLQERRLLRRHRVHARQRRRHAGRRRRRPIGDRRTCVTQGPLSAHLLRARSRAATGHRLHAAGGGRRAGAVPADRRSIFSLYSDAGSGPGLRRQSAVVRDRGRCHSPNGVRRLPRPAGRALRVHRQGAERRPGGHEHPRPSPPSAGRKVEICGNGIDDDGNGLTDCDDPACFGIAGCPPPACIADQNLGAISVGTRRDRLRRHPRRQHSFTRRRAAAATARRRVLRVNRHAADEPRASTARTAARTSSSCRRQLQPLDACNANEINCVDPATLPFGCELLAPGSAARAQYNLIVAGVPGRRRGDGLPDPDRHPADRARDLRQRHRRRRRRRSTDCADRKCVTAAACAKFACRPDQSAGLLPLDGTPQSEVVQTAMAGDDQKMTACASAPGGQDGDVDFQLPALADVTIQWAQVGNHDFALYADQGTLFACDAGAVLACVSTTGSPPGRTCSRRCRRAATTWSSTPTAPAKRAGSSSSCRPRRRRCSFST